jgi:hypothetical protein
MDSVLLLWLHGQARSRLCGQYFIYWLKNPSRLSYRLVLVVLMFLFDSLDRDFAVAPEFLGEYSFNKYKGIESAPLIY